MTRRGRHRRDRLVDVDRDALERAGWRTWLEFREDHVRSDDGTLVAVEARWTAEAEHATGRFVTASVVAATPGLAWARLRDEVDRQARWASLKPLQTRVAAAAR